MKRFALFVLMTVSLTIPGGLAAKSTKPVTLSEAVRHQLAMLPRYSVFDNLGFEVNGGTVTLTGEVARPIVKDDALKAVRQVEGVTMVIDRIEVLPLSPDDERLRRAVYRAIYGSPELGPRYAVQAAPPIHIIVKNGVVKLAGVVATQSDRIIAGMRANSVFGSFKVENDLQVGS